MIEKIKVKALPFVDGAPNPDERPDQARVNWMKNGECMEAASTDISNEGSLNRSGVEIQKNVDQVHTDLNKVNTVVSTVIDKVNAHSAILDQSDNQDLITTVKIHTDEIETLNEAVVQLDSRSDAIDAMAKATKEDVGVVPEHDTADRTVRDELEFQKIEMGSYPGFDYNGMPDPDSDGSGIKNRLANVTMEVTNHQSRINELETNWASSDVGSLTRELNNVRSELGPRREAQMGHSVYNRLDGLEASRDGKTKDIKDIHDQIGFSSFPRPGYPTLINLIDENVKEFADSKIELSELNQRVILVETSIGNETSTGSIHYNQKVFAADISDLYKIVGRSNSEGLRYSVVSLQGEIGDNKTQGTIKNRLLLTEQGIRDLNIDVSRLNDLLGADGSGSSDSFYERVGELELQMNGDSNGQSEFERLGLYQFAHDLWSQRPIGDAPDDSLYFRKNGEWSKLGSENISISDDKGIINDTVGNVISVVNGEVVLGGSDVVVKGTVKELKVKDAISMNADLDDQTVSVNLASLSVTSTDKTITLGEDTATVNIVGEFLVNGAEVGKGTVVDVEPSDEMFIRKHGVWISTDKADVPVKKLISREYDDSGIAIEDTDKTIIEHDKNNVYIGSEKLAVTVHNAKEIKTKGLKIVDDISTVLQTSDTRVTIGRPLFVGTDKVWSDANDAPKDGEYYARIDGAWSKIDPTGEGSGTGISDAPNDDNYYLRRNNAWSILGESDISLNDKLSLRWETATANNFTGVKYDKAVNTITLGGSGAKVDINGAIKQIVLDENGGITQKTATGDHSIISANTDSDIFVGSSDVTKSVVLRGKESPQARIGNTLYKVWTSKDEAPIDDKMYGRKNGEWKPFEVNRTLDVILNNGYSFKVVDTKNKIMNVATSGPDNMIRIGQADTYLNIDSTLRSLKLDNKVSIKAVDASGDIDILGLNDSIISLGTATKDLVINAKTAKINGADIWTSASDVPTDGNKYVRRDGKWETAYGYGADAPSSVGAKEGDVYFQHM